MVSANNANTESTERTQTRRCIPHIANLKTTACNIYVQINLFDCMAMHPMIRHHCRHMQAKSWTQLKSHHLSNSRFHILVEIPMKSELLQATASSQRLDFASKTASNQSNQHDGIIVGIEAKARSIVTGIV